MARPDKAATVAELKEQFSSSAAVVLTEYRGLKVKDLKELRRSLGADATYAVAKNTLATVAAREAGIEGLDSQLSGPTAITFINGDIATVAKGLRDFAKANPALVIKGGVLDGRVLDAKSVTKLADLESREVLLAKLAGGLQANLSRAVYMIAAPLSQAARVLGALEQAATADPSLIGGAGSAPAADQTQNDADSASTPEAEAAGTDEADASAATTTEGATSDDAATAASE